MNAASGFDRFDHDNRKDGEKNHEKIAYFAASILFAPSSFGQSSPGSAATVLFNFDNAQTGTPILTSPVGLTESGLTANFTATGQGFSIQTANDGGVFPQPPIGFAGNSIWPSSVFPADLLISFSQPLTAFSILYAVQDLNTSTSSTM